MNSIIISAFPGCGKTYLSEHKENFNYSIIDLESSLFKKSPNWECKYVDCIVSNMKSTNFILISQQDNVLSELNRRNIPFVIVVPNNSEQLSARERNLIKQQWFGRFLLRNNSHIENLSKWIQKLNHHYDKWTNTEYLRKFAPEEHIILLKADQYLSDIIKQISL